MKHRQNIHQIGTNTLSTSNRIDPLDHSESAREHHHGKQLTSLSSGVTSSKKTSSHDHYSSKDVTASFSKEYHYIASSDCSISIKFVNKKNHSKHVTSLSPKVSSSHTSHYTSVAQREFSNYHSSKTSAPSLRKDDHSETSYSISIKSVNKKNHSEHAISLSPEVSSSHRPSSRDHSLTTRRPSGHYLSKAPTRSCSNERNFVSLVSKGRKNLESVGGPWK